MNFVDMHGIDEPEKYMWTQIDTARTGMTEMLIGHNTRTLNIAVDNQQQQIDRSSTHAKADDGQKWPSSSRITEQ